MLNQLSTASPDLASLLASGYLMESPPPTDPIDPIDPPDNQGGGSGTTSSEPEEEEGSVN
jgi:hypothetical protein